MSNGFNLSNECIVKLKDYVCAACLKGKQTRKPFKEVRTRASRPLEILHTDLCGPFDPESWDGMKYFITVLDDYTHYVTVHLLRGKYEANKMLKEVVNEYEAKWNMKTAKIRCDNGKEYINNDLINWCKNKGIVVDCTISYTPQLNGKSERMNRTLLDKARTLIHDAKVEKEMWGEAIRVAAFLTNRMPTESLTEDKTPYEMWHNKKPDLQYLQIFGTIAYAKKLTYLKKLDERSEEYMFVGYASNGYRLFDKTSRKIVIARDVVVDNSKFTRRIKTTEDSTTNWFEDENEEDEDPDENEEHEDSDENEENEDSDENEDENTNENKEDQDLDEVEAARKETNAEEQENPKNPNEEQITDKRKRQRRPPKRFEDYVYLTFEDVLKSDDSENWKKAINEEKQSLKENNTWTVINKEDIKDKEVITNRWIFKIKEDGTYKARLVVRGCQQERGIDYQDTFSPVINANIIRLLFAIAVKKNYLIKKFDIKTAFLYGNLQEEVYMEIPDGYNIKNKESKVCKLNKALYGLKQAPVQWNKHFTDFLKETGLIPLKTEQCLFKTPDNELILAIYVDDGLILGKDPVKIEDFLNKLRNKFKMTMYEKPKVFLGINIEREDTILKLHQQNTVLQILENFNMTDCSGSKIPLSKADIKDEEISGIDTTTNFPYREAVGSLLYLTNKTRPDLSYSVNYVSRHMENPTTKDVNNIKHILKYLKNTSNLGIKFEKEKTSTSKQEEKETHQLVAYSDADYAEDKKDRRSTTGFIIFLNKGPIAWGTRKQPIVALSTTETEYIAAA